MSSIPKKPIRRGNGPGPKPRSDSLGVPIPSPHLDMPAEHREKLGELLWDAIDACQELRHFLARYSDPFGGFAYSPDLDLNYRAMRRRAIAPLSWMSEGRAVASMVFALPPRLSDVPTHDEFGWGPGWIGAQEVIDYQADLLTIIDQLGIAPRPVGPAPQPSLPVQNNDADAIDAVATAKIPDPRKTEGPKQRQIADRRNRVGKYWRNGMTQKEIAEREGVNVKTIQGDLNANKAQAGNSGKPSPEEIGNSRK